MTWKRIRPREYQIRADGYIAEVFAAPKGYTWAWAIWHQKGVDSGVAMTFIGAKHLAEEIIEAL